MSARWNFSRDESAFKSEFKRLYQKRHNLKQAAKIVARRPSKPPPTRPAKPKPKPKLAPTAAQPPSVALRVLSAIIGGCNTLSLLREALPDLKPVTILAALYDLRQARIISAAKDGYGVWREVVNGEAAEAFISGASSPSRS